MPTYAYACTACGHAFDMVQSFTEDALTECPQCSGRLRKKFGNFGVAFKGAGFYRNDARNASTTGSANGGSSETTSTEGSSDSGTSSPDSSGESGSSGGGKSPAASAPAASGGGSGD